MSASKMDHKELQRRLKEDELAHFFQEIRDSITKAYEEYGRQIVLGIALIAAIFIAYKLWSMNSASQFEASQRLYSNAVAYVQNDQYTQALNELNSLMEDYSSSKIAVPASLLRANCYVKTGEFNNALNDYRNAVSKMSPDDAITVRFSIVQTLRSLSDTDKALEELSIIEKQAKSPIVKEEILFLRGCCYEDKNDSAKALEALKAIPAKSRFYSLAVEKIQWLEAKPVEAVNAK